MLPLPPTLLLAWKCIKHWSRAQQIRKVLQVVMGRLLFCQKLGGGISPPPLLTPLVYRGSPPYEHFGTWKKPCYMKFVLVGLYYGPLLQGVSYWNVLFELTLTDRNMQARICLKVVLITWVWGICVSSTSFQKNYIGWPQQPPTEKVLKFNMIFHDSTQKNSNVQPSWSC
jgi:hypothetical protein